jgi:hypothetical protein
MSQRPTQQPMNHPLKYVMSSYAFVYYYPPNNQTYSYSTHTLQRPNKPSWTRSLCTSCFSRKSSSVPATRSHCDSNSSRSRRVSSYVQCTSSIHHADTTQQQQQRQQSLPQWDTMSVAAVQAETEVGYKSRRQNAAPVAAIARVKHRARTALITTTMLRHWVGRLRVTVVARRFDKLK